MCTERINQSYYVVTDPDLKEGGELSPPFIPRPLIEDIIDLYLQVEFATYTENQWVRQNFQIREGGGGVKLKFGGCKWSFVRFLSVFDRKNSKFGEYSREFVGWLAESLQRILLPVLVFT